eukprot:gene3106-2088_t
MLNYFGGVSVYIQGLYLCDHLSLGFLFWSYKLCATWERVLLYFDGDAFFRIMYWWICNSLVSWYLLFACAFSVQTSVYGSGCCFRGTYSLHSFALRPVFLFYTWDFCFVELCAPTALRFVLVWLFTVACCGAHAVGFHFVCLPLWCLDLQLSLPEISIICLVLVFILAVVCCCFAVCDLRCIDMWCNRFWLFVTCLCYLMADCVITPTIALPGVVAYMCVDFDTGSQCWHYVVVRSALVRRAVEVYVVVLASLLMGCDFVIGFITLVTDGLPCFYKADGFGLVTAYVFLLTDTPS